ncbi:MAG: DUF2339 domain-containing protein, partial [Thermoanaerobaculia bacterium]
VLFALAGLYFVRYAVESGWLAPSVRVALGLLAGVAAVAGSELMRRRGYGPTANALAGGGVVVLYAAVWAARTLYGLIPAAVAFATMGVVTVAAGVLAWRHRSQVVAVLGLAGGFATPLLLQAEADRPLGLFGYLLLLNVGLVVLARRRRWPLLAPLGLVATLLWEGFWIVSRMGPGDLPLSLGVLAVFAALFALATPAAGLGGLRGREPDAGDTGPGGPGTWSRAAGLLAPFGFLLYLAFRADLTPHVWPLALLMLILSVAAEALERTLDPRTSKTGPGGRDEGLGEDAGGPAPPAADGTTRTALPEALPLGAWAATASVAVVAAWLLRSLPVDAGGAWEAVGVCLVLVAAFHAFAEGDLHRGGNGATGSETGEAAAGAVGRSRRGPFGALLTGGGFLGLLVLAPLLAGPAPGLSAGTAWYSAWISGWLALGAVLVRQGWLPGVRRRPVVAAAVLGLAFPVLHLRHGGSPAVPGAELHYLWLLVSALALQGLAVLRERGREGLSGAGRWEEPAALALPLAALVPLGAQSAMAELSPGPYLVLTLGLGLLAVLSATRLPDGAACLAAILLVAGNHLAWAHALVQEGAAPTVLLGALAGLGAGVVLWTAWPFLAVRRLQDEPAAWWAAALAGPVWFLALRPLWVERFGDGALGLLPVLLGAISLVGAFRSRVLWPPGDRRRLRGVVWFSAVALGFAALAVPLQLDKEWITVAWALEGLAVVALWRRLDHPGLKWFGLALLAAVTVRLVLNPEVAGYHPRSGLPVVNWLLYTYLVPAACLVGAALILGRREAARAAPWERRLYAGGRPVGALVAGMAAVVVVFVWINLTVFDAFSTVRHLSVDTARTMARDLTLSLGWALYALVLLGLGFARRSRGLRGIGLGLLTLTVMKLFLYDLAGLEDLYRVASLLGLAVSLVLVSVAYQRFVFRGKTPPGGRP